jgi:aminopeptidase N
MVANIDVPTGTWEDTQVGYSVSTDMEGNPFYYLLSWLGGCDRFGPCDAAPDRFATYRFTVTHPSGTDVLCPGTIVADDTITICDFAWPGGPTYSTFAIVASPSWTATDMGTSASGVRLTLYDTPSTGIVDDFSADQHLAFIDWMAERFGPYPYGDELRLATGPTAWAGFEHPGNIVLYDHLNTIETNYADKLSNITNHEIAHMWAGGETTVASVYDFVAKEAMAEYLTFVFEEEEIDVAVARKTAAAWKANADYASDYYPYPEDKPRLVDFSGHVYGSGPFVLLRQIEALFDRDTVFVALSDLLGEQRAISVSDFQDALEAATGADLEHYFDVWVYGEGKPSWPRFAVDIADLGGGEVSVTLTQANPEDGLFGCAFNVMLMGAEGSERHKVWVDLGIDGRAVTTVTATPGFVVTRNYVDSDYQCLAWGTPATPTSAPANLPVHPWRAPTLPVPYPPADKK